jgi:hypothetical protein
MGVRTGSAPVEDNDDWWTLTLVSVYQGYNGPEHQFQKLTFERTGAQVRLIEVEASEGLPEDVASNIDRLLEAPHAMKATPVDRCLGDAGSGYKYTPRGK